MKNKDSEKLTGYAVYVLIVLFLAFILSLIDRNIFSFFAQQIKESLHLKDAHLGFLYGTAFSIFFAIFGLPMARLADVWSRKKTIGIGLLLWSLMTALSGTAQNFTSLAIFRFGLGIGEAALAPAGISLLADYFPKRFRGIAIGFFASGAILGAGLALLVGAFAIKLYYFLFPLGQAPFHLQAWQFAFLVVGIPGILLGLWVFSLRDPKSEHEQPWKVFFAELGAIIPPFSIITLVRKNAGKKVITINLLTAILCFFMAIILIKLTGDIPQWSAMALGIYGFFSWLARLKLVDPSCFDMIFKNKTLLFATIGLGFFMFSTAGTLFWMPSYAIRYFHPNLVQMGFTLGLSVAIMGTLGSIIGGNLSDWFRKKSAHARIFPAMFSALLSLPMILLLFTTSSLTYFYIYAFLYSFTAFLWCCVPGTLAIEVVLPGMRATAIAFFILVYGIIGFSLGPYLFGHMSDLFISKGFNSADSIRNAILIGLIPLLISVALFFLSIAPVRGFLKTLLIRRR